MLSDKVMAICDANFDYVCEKCPLQPVCSIPTPEQPGNSLREKTIWWSEQMNKAAEEVRL